MGDIEITIALDRYDRHFPLFDGTAVAAPGLRYRALQVGQSDALRDGTRRHERMIAESAFDVAEFSMSTYLMAIERGLPLTGVPIFPRRLFSQACMFVREDSAIEHPRDLVGKRVGLSSFQTTLSLLAKGDLKFEYGVAWEDIRWLLTSDEKVKFAPKPGVVMERAPRETDLGDLLAKGEIDAIFMPHPPHSVMNGAVKTRRLFRDTAVEERRYFNKLGYWPIMHVLAMRTDLAAREPVLPSALMALYASALEISDRYFDDPNWSRLPDARLLYERSRAEFGDPWRNGFRANRGNLERFILYSHDQGLIGERYEPERLFVASTLDT